MVCGRVSGPQSHNRVCVCSVRVSREEGERSGREQHTCSAWWSFEREAEEWWCCVCIVCGEAKKAAKSVRAMNKRRITIHCNECLSNGE